MNRNIIRRIIIGTVAILAGLVLAQLIYNVNIYLEKRANHEKVVRLINEDLMFRWDTMDEDLANIQNWIDRGHFSNEDLGRLYERASLIYMQKGETLPYYRYLGYALYYLERSEEKDYTINVYLDLANFFLNNYAEDSARKMIEEARNIEEFDDIEDIQIRSYAYRMMGIISILDEDYENAEIYLEKSQDTVALSHTNVYEECYEAINDTWLARVYYETGRLDECQEKLDKWEGNEMFTTDIFREILLRDLIVPYYQVKCMLSSARIYEDRDRATQKELEAKDMEVADVYGEFIDLCEENGYEKAELSTLLKLQGDYPPVSDEGKRLLFDKLQVLYTRLFDNQNITYANVIDSTVLNSIAEMEKYELNEKNAVRRRRFIIATTIATFLILVTLIIIILNSRIDGLTRLLNRKAFNHALSRTRRRKLEYGIIMLDIDHFKNVNDTYGHQNGDVVLEHLGELMLSEISPDVHCFRYGGEEFVILLDKKAVPYGHAIAERVRTGMEQSKWLFAEDEVITISAGVASGIGDADVLKKADENLYYSKENGRNRITVSDC